MRILSPTLSNIEPSTIPQDHSTTQVVNDDIPSQASDLDIQVYIQPVFPSPEFKELVKPQVTIIINYKE